MADKKKQDIFSEELFDSGSFETIRLGNETPADDTNVIFEDLLDGFSAEFDEDEQRLKQTALDAQDIELLELIASGSEDNKFVGADQTLVLPELEETVSPMEQVKEPLEDLIGENSDQDHPTQSLFSPQPLDSEDEDDYQTGPIDMILPGEDHHEKQEKLKKRFRIIIIGVIAFCVIVIGALAYSAISSNSKNGSLTTGTITPDSSDSSTTGPTTNATKRDDVDSATIDTSTNTNSSSTDDTSSSQESTSDQQTTQEPSHTQDSTPTDTNSGAGEDLSQDTSGSEETVTPDAGTGDAGTESPEAAEN